MSPRRYLFGPISADQANQRLRGPRAAGDCLAFGHTDDADLVIGPDDDWQTGARRFPEAWQPDFVVLNLAAAHIPAALWSVPLPIIGLASDWHLHWHYYRRRLHQCDLVLTDGAGADRLRAAGIEHVWQADLAGCARDFVESEWPALERDIDVLFVGDVHPALQRGRLPWLGRIARLGERWNALFRPGVAGEEYRRLLARARIVFINGLAGDVRQQACEAAAAGALVFQEEGGEGSSCLRDRQECVCYGANNFEALLKHYLEREEERARLAHAARTRGADFTFEKLWEQQVEAIGREWPALVERASRRLRPDPAAELFTRTWQMLGCSSGEDRSLFRDLRDELDRQPGSSDLHNAMGLVVTWVNQRSGPVTAALAQSAADHFERAWGCDPGNVIAGLNLVEVLVGLEQNERAISLAQELLAVLDWPGLLEQPVRDAGHFPPVFDHFRVEWERAAWQLAGDPAGETQAKRALICWRLHLILAELTGDLIHFFEAHTARPDLPLSQAALGCALARAGRPVEAATYLQRALAANPFDVNAAFSLFHVLGDKGDGCRQQRLAQERRLFARVAERIVPAEDWFALPARSAAPGLRVPAGILWEGAQVEIHSFSLINREVCRRLVERGHDVGLLAIDAVPGTTLRDERLAPHFNRKPEKTHLVHVQNRWPPDFTPPAEGHWVVMQPWEFGSLPKAWLEPMTTQVDEVWVPSRSVLEGYVRSGVPAERVQVIPFGVGPAFSSATAPLPLPTTRKFKFLFVGGTIFRKGIDVLLEAFVRAFTSDDDVCLVIKDTCGQSFYQGQTAEQQVARYQSLPGAAEVHYLNRELSDEEMPGLYTACDCLVQPYRGEGFGLPIAEAMACGLPVIVTGHGAALDFCTSEHGYFIPARLGRVKQKRAGDFETVDHPWLAEPDRNALTLLLRYVVQNAEEARAKGRAGAEHIHRHFTWEQTVDAIEARIEVLRARPINRQLVRVGPIASRPRVSLAMIVKNEEANLPVCLDSVVGLFDEMVIVDTGSTDRTKEIAASRGARVFDFPWVDHFAAARNESIRHATAEWIFWLDADDRLDEANRLKLKELLAGLKDENIAYVMKCICLPDQSGTTTVVDHVRLFRNRPEMRWKYRVHEQILPALRTLGGDVRWSDVVIQHVGYQDQELRKRKLERDLRLLKIENDEQPDDPFTLFNLGSVYQELGRVADAVTVLRRSLERSHPADSIVRKLYALLSQCHRHFGQKELALAACRKGREFYPDDVELLFQE
ncbi:MAG: glycosyltransferase, partial [Gemmataceae bacterium]